MTLSVTKSGTGTGTVTSAPAGISCGATCSQVLTPGSAVTLTATPAAGSTFAGWSGACSGTGACNVTVNAATSVTATFALAPVTLSVTKSGTGTGTVTGTSAGISCGATCSQALTPGTAVTLTATPDAGSTFVGWSGACSGTGTCAVTVNAATSVTATFTLVPMTLSVTKGGTGAGTVTSTPAGISCGATCSQTLTPGTAVTLTATPAAGSTFAGWSGACSGTGPCNVTINAAVSVTATFTSTTMMLSVTRDGIGTGTVTSTPAGIDCGVSCSQVVTAGASFTLTATATSGSTFTGWSGACSGTGTCPVTVNGVTAVNATFSSARVDRAFGQNPSPVASSLSPANASAGSPGITLTVSGSGFVATAVVRWNGADRPTTFVSSTQLRATIPVSDLSTARSVPVTAFNPKPGGGTSASVSFTITPAAMPSPLVTPITADSAGATFVVSWTPVSGVTSYRYSAAFDDGTAAQQGTVTVRSIQLRMPYHVSGAAMGGFVCIYPVTAAGQPSVAYGCNAVAVPARPTAAATAPTAKQLAADASGVTFAITWAPVNGAGSYRYAAAFDDGTAGQQGLVTFPSLQLRMPYHVSGAARDGFVCISPVSAGGQAPTTNACNVLPGAAAPVMSIALPVALRPTGLVAAYGFDEVSGSTATDLSGNNNTGTLGTGIARTTQGRFGGALVFNGSGFVAIPPRSSRRCRPHRRHETAG